jgi:phage replication O-like protein O
MSKEREPAKPGFTKFDNYFLDHVMPRVTSAEWKIISAVIRETAGWHRTDAEITIGRFMALTGLARQAVVTAIKKACRRTVIKRSTQQLRKQRTFRFSATVHANLQSVPKPDPRRRQQALPFTSEYENQTPLNSLKIKLPSAGSQFENQTPIAPVLNSLKKDQDLKKHTHQVEPGQRVWISKFSRQFRAQYAREENLGRGWLYNSGDGRYDVEIAEVLEERQAVKQRADAAKSQVAQPSASQHSENPPNWRGTPLEPWLETVKGKVTATHFHWFEQLSFEGEADDGAYLISASNPAVRDYLEKYQSSHLQLHSDGRPLRWIKRKSKATAA